MLICLGLILFQLLCLLKKCDSVYEGDSNTRMKLKILQLDRELVLEAIRNVQRVEHFRNLYILSITYDIGDLIYKIRSKFARMTRLLILSHDKIYLYKREQLIDHLSEIQKLAMEIYALVEIVEDWETTGEHQTRRPRIPKFPTNLNNATRWHSAPPLRQRSRRIGGTTKSLEKKILNYEGFDSDSY